MFEQDYIMRLVIQFAQALKRSMERANQENNPAAAAETIEAAIGQVTEMDGDTLLSLAPESMKSIMQVSGTDPQIAEYIARSLKLESMYLREAGQNAKADIRATQAEVVAEAYGLELPDIPFTEEELLQLIEEDEQ